jgi:hypothetical protein
MLLLLSMLRSRSPKPEPPEPAVLIPTLVLLLLLLLLLVRQALHNPAVALLLLSLLKCRGMLLLLVLFMPPVHAVAAVTCARWLMLTVRLPPMIQLLVLLAAAVEA